MKIKKTLVMAALLATGMLGMHTPAVAAEMWWCNQLLYRRSSSRGLMSPCWPK